MLRIRLKAVMAKLTASDGNISLFSVTVDVGHAQAAKPFPS
jgi:hypothetical protein